MFLYESRAQEDATRALPLLWRDLRPAWHMQAVTHPALSITATSSRTESADLWRAARSSSVR